MSKASEAMKWLDWFVNKPMRVDEEYEDKIKKFGFALRDRGGPKTLSDDAVCRWALKLRGTAFAHRMGRMSRVTQLPMPLKTLVNITTSNRARAEFYYGMVSLVQAVSARNGCSIRNAAELVVCDAFALHGETLTRATKRTMTKWLTGEAHKKKARRRSFMALASPGDTSRRWIYLQPAPYDTLFSGSRTQLLRPQITEAAKAAPEWVKKGVMKCSIEWMGMVRVGDMELDRRSGE